MIMFLAIVLLWMTSLTVSKRIAERVVPVPENGLMYERCDNAWEYTQETSASYGRCVDAQIDFCQKKFVLMFSILKDQTATAMAVNQQKLAYLESWNGGCTHAHLAIVKKRLQAWVAKNGANTLALERIVDTMPSSITIRSTGEIKSCIDVSRALKTIADSGCHGDACVESVHDAALVENARFTADAVNHSGRLSNYISQRSTYDQEYVASATNYSLNLDGFAVDIPLKMPDADFSLDIPDLVGNASLPIIDAQEKLERERAALVLQYTELQDEAAAYKAAADTQLERAQTIITNVDNWYGAIPVDADLSVFPDTSFSPTLPSLCDPDESTDCVLPGSNIPEIFGEMSDDLGDQLGEELGALNEELAKELNATANAIADAVPEPPPYNPPSLGGKPANESQSDFVQSASEHSARAGDYLGQLANATLDFVESSLENIWNISASISFRNLTVAADSAAGGSPVGMVTVSKAALEAGFAEAFGSFAGIDSVDPAAPTVAIKSIQTRTMAWGTRSTSSTRW